MNVIDMLGNVDMSDPPQIHVAILPAGDGLEMSIMCPHGHTQRDVTVQDLGHRMPQHLIPDMFFYLWQSQILKHRDQCNSIVCHKAIRYHIVLLMQHMFRLNGNINELVHKFIKEENTCRNPTAI